MKLCCTWWLLVFACAGPGLAGEQLQLLAGSEPPSVFAGGARRISVSFSNSGSEVFAADTHLRILQTGSATAAPLGETAWKRLQVLPLQTVLESAQLDFPVVNARTKFFVQWLAGTNRVIGQTEVLVYPTNLLVELKLMLASDALGVLDPNAFLKPSFRRQDVTFLELGETTLEDFSGKLAIVGPFQSRAQMREGLAQAIRQIARKGTAVIWIQPPPEPGDEITPSFYVVPEGKTAVVVVQSDLVADFFDNPKSQLNLIHFCKLALNPVPPQLPNLSFQP